MTARPILSAGSDAAFETALSSVFRLETLQSYGNSGEDPALEAFVTGQPHVLTTGKRNWRALVRARRRAGCTMQRVHVVTEPLTDYVRFELTWSYSPNIEAGEHIRIIPVVDGQSWPVEVPQATDFWLFDAHQLYVMDYEPDGTWLGAELVADPARIEQACRWRDATLRLGTPWVDYIRSRPKLARHVE